MKKMLTIASIACISFCAATAGNAGAKEDAIKINRDGYRLYKQNELASAVGKFREAIGVDPDNALAHYNLACTIARLYPEGDCPEYSLEEVYENLIETLRLSPGKIEKMRTDPDLDYIRNQARFLILTQQFNPKKEPDVLSLLRNFTWQSERGGVKSFVWALRFFPDRSVVLDLNGAREFEGSYSVNGSRISIVINGPVAHEDQLVNHIDGEISSEGTLQLSGELGALEFVNYRPDNRCSA